MTTTDLDLASMAIALAEAKKPCPEQPPIIIGQEFDCDTCKDTPGEVYVLDSSVREWCPLAYVEDYREAPHPVEHAPEAGDPCRICKNTGYQPLDPEKLGRWMVALAEAGYISNISTQRIDYHVLIQRRKGPGFWEAAAETPPSALIQAAMKALGLGAEEE